MQLNIRNLLPIESCFTSEDKVSNKQTIFGQTKERLTNVLDDNNVYKIAKLMGLSFESEEIEAEVIYIYLTLLASREILSTQEIDITQEH